jgi:phosphate-selective porin OprO and OprP
VPSVAAVYTTANDLATADHLRHPVSPLRGVTGPPDRKRTARFSLRQSFAVIGSRLPYWRSHAADCRRARFAGATAREAVLAVLAVLVPAVPALASPPEPAKVEEVAEEELAEEELAEEEVAEEEVAEEELAEEEAADEDPEPEEVAPPTHKKLETIPGLYPENTGMFVGKGIWAGTPDRRFTFRMTGFVHLDARFAADIGAGDDTTSQLEGFVRRGRVTLDGRLWGQLEYRLMWDQVIDPVIPYDFHIDWRPIPQFNIRLGGFKSAFGFERRGRSYALLFVERGMPTALAPNREMGLFFYGQTRNGFFSYDVAVGTGNENLGALYHVDRRPDFSGRVYFQPFRLGRGPTDFPALKYFGVGVSWTLGTEHGTEGETRVGGIRATPRRSVYGGRQLFRYLDDDLGVTVAHGIRDRQSVHGHWHHGRFQTLFEYVRSAQRVARGFDDAGAPLLQAYLAHHAWQAVFSVNLTGDENTFFGVTPSRPFNWGKGQWGSMTTSFRYHELYIDRRAFPQFGDPDLWARTIRAVTGSFQWHINYQFELHFDAEWMLPGGTAANLPSELALMTRLEIRY